MAKGGMVGSSKCHRILYFCNVEGKEVDCMNGATIADVPLHAPWSSIVFRPGISAECVTRDCRNTSSGLEVAGRSPYPMQKAIYFASQFPYRYCKEYFGSKYIIFHIS